MRRKRRGKKRAAVLALSVFAFLAAAAGARLNPEALQPVSVSVTAAQEETEFRAETATGAFSPEQVPEYTDSPSVEVNGGVPYFTEEEFTTDTYKSFSELDDLGRCGVAMACLDESLMPDEPRESIGMIRPSGWHTVKYDGIDGNYLYNRCHLIAYELSGQNANELNLITGTRYMNVEGMLPYENQTAQFLRESGMHVLYRVTPVFEGDDLVARGVLMEAESVEDRGEGLCFCVYCYNVQPGVTIDYSDGSSEGPAFTGDE